MLTDCMQTWLAEKWSTRAHMVGRGGQPGWQERFSSMANMLCREMSTTSANMVGRVVFHYLTAVDPIHAHKVRYPIWQSSST